MQRPGTGIFSRGGVTESARERLNRIHREEQASKTTTTGVARGQTQFHRRPRSASVSSSSVGAQGGPAPQPLPVPGKRKIPSPPSDPIRKDVVPSPGSVHTPKKTKVGRTTMSDLRQQKRNQEAAAHNRLVSIKFGGGSKKRLREEDTTELEELIYDPDADDEDDEPNVPWSPPLPMSPPNVPKGKGKGKEITQVFPLGGELRRSAKPSPSPVPQANKGPKDKGKEDPVPKGRERKEKRSMEGVVTKMAQTKPDPINPVKLGAVRKDKAGIDRGQTAMQIEKQKKTNPVVTMKDALSTGPLPEDPTMADVVPPPGEEGEEMEADPPEESEDLPMPNQPQDILPPGEMEGQEETDPADEFLPQAPEGEEEPEPLDPAEVEFNAKEARQEESDSFEPNWREKFANEIKSAKFTTVLNKFQALRGNIVAAKQKMVPPVAPQMGIAQNVVNEAGTNFVNFVNDDLRGREALVEANTLEENIDRIIGKFDGYLTNEIPKVRSAIMTKVRLKNAYIANAVDGTQEQFNQALQESNQAITNDLDTQLRYVHVDLGDSIDRIDFFDNIVDDFNRQFVELDAAFYAAPEAERVQKAKELADAFEAMMGKLAKGSPYPMEKGSTYQKEDKGITSRFDKRDAVIKQMAIDSPPTDADLAGLGKGQQPMGGYQGPYDFKDMNMLKEYEVFPYGTLEFWTTDVKVNKKTGLKEAMHRPKYFAKEKKAPESSIKEVLKKDMPKAKSRGSFVQRWAEEQERLTTEKKVAGDQRRDAMLSNYKADRYNEHKKANAL